MWEFIKYCLYCFGIAISAAFGNNPDGLSINTAIVGIITMYVLVGLFLLFLWLFVLIVNLIRRSKNKNNPKDPYMWTE